MLASSLLAIADTCLLVFHVPVGLLECGFHSSPHTVLCAMRTDRGMMMMGSHKNLLFVFFGWFCSAIALLSISTETRKGKNNKF